jgi:hypothetical protein
MTPWPRCVLPCRPQHERPDRLLSALTTVIWMNDKVEEMAGLMREQQRRIVDLQARVIRLETVLELALNRPPLTGCRWLEEE